MARKKRRCGRSASAIEKQKDFRSYINPKVGMRLVNTFEECFEKLRGEEHPQDKLAALTVSRSVVSLASYQGRTRVFACTGTIIKRDASTMSILTSASLVRCSNDENKLANKLKIKILLPNGKSVEGKLWKYDLHYNIAVVNIKDFPDLCPAFLYSHIGAGKVVAIGRVFESGELMTTTGILRYNNSNLDCQELMISTCKITKAGIGGPLISTGGNFIGMNFYYTSEVFETPRAIWFHELILEKAGDTSEQVEAIPLEMVCT
uniref:Uncharacterized protein n=1 Tax=Leersia perrieri TaxID=77586 RepID=A0A0D9XIF4_9ORYZ